MPTHDLQHEADMQTTKPSRHGHSCQIYHNIIHVSGLAFIGFTQYEMHGENQSKESSCYAIPSQYLY